jgi:hypothetical protein
MLGLLFNSEVILADSPNDLEKGDVVFNYLPVWFNYHSGIYLDYEGGDTDDQHNHQTAEQTRAGYVARTFYEFTHNLWGYVGGRTESQDIAVRTGIVDTARNNVDIRRPYVEDWRRQVIEWRDGLSGNPVDGILQVGEILRLRCDGWVELVYALNGIHIQNDIIHNTDWYNELNRSDYTIRTPVTQYNAMNPSAGTPPILTVTDSENNVIPDNGTTNDKNITVKVDDGPTGSGLCHFEVFQGANVNSTPLSSYWDDTYYDTQSHTYTLNGLPDGQICIRVFDQAGNYTLHRFTIDTTPPPAPSPDDGVEGFSSDTTPTFWWARPSDASGISGYYWKVPPGSDTWTTSNYVTLSPQADGTHTFYVKAKDRAGNTGAYGSHSFTISTVDKTQDPELGGVDFRSAELVYISGDALTQGGIQFVIKAEQALPEEPTINLYEEKEPLLSLFLAALAIPNHKQWVSLPVRWDGEKWVGAVQIEDVLAKTELGRILLDADVKMKFSDLNVMKDMFIDLKDLWTNLVRNSPYYSQIYAQGFNTYPSWVYRTWIRPDEVTANAETNKIFISTYKVGVRTELMRCELDLSSYRFSQAIVDDLNQRFQTWKQAFIDKLKTIREPTIAESLNNDPEYKDMREAYAAVAIAQWYKQQDTSNLLYRDLIDSEDITGLEIPFDRDYWTNQALQYIDTYSWIDFFGREISAELWGGAVLVDTIVDVTPGISQEDKELVSQAIEELYVKVGNTYYIGDEIREPQLDLVPAVLYFSQDTPGLGEEVIITSLIRNQGQQDSGAFDVAFYDRYTHPDGQTRVYKIAFQAVEGLPADSIKELNQSWTAGFGSLLGTHKIYAELDYYNSVDESNEKNNIIQKEIVVLNSYPIVTITSPENGAVFTSNRITFEGSGTDPQDGVLLDSSLSWSSSIDGGPLGTGSLLTVDLSLGTHIIPGMLKYQAF